MHKDLAAALVGVTLGLVLGIVGLSAQATEAHAVNSLKVNSLKVNSL